MNRLALVVVTLMLASARIAYTQSTAEYSTLTTTPATASNPIGTTSRALAKKAANLNAAMSKSVPNESPSPDKSASVAHGTLPGPTAPAVFILSNGERLESTHYLLTITSLRVQQGEMQRTIPLSAVNLDATVAANHERGIDLKIPKNRSEVMLSF